MEIPSSPLPACLSPRRSCDSSTSLEFEFNPTFPSPTALPSADELFFGGVILPLHLLPSTHPNPPPDPDPDPNPPYSSPNANPDSVSYPPQTDPEPGPGPSPDSDASPSILSAGVTTSKRWRDIFKKSDKKPPSEENKDKEKHKEREKEKKRGRKKGGSAAGSSAELININLWPFSRSRSAGNNAAGRPRSAMAARKVSSAPCSRSNSAGESKSRRWPSSPARAVGGVHLGRTSPVWQLPRTVSTRAEKGKKLESGEGNRRNKAVKGGISAGGATSSGSGGKGRVLNLNVPMCIGYRHHLSCRSDETSAIGSGGGGVGDGGRQGSAGRGPRTVGNSGGNLFNLRTLFSKKVY